MKFGATGLLMLAPAVATPAIAATAPQGPIYSVKRLGTLTGASFTQASGINNLGSVVGGIGGSSNCLNGCAVLWSGTTPTVLKSPIGTVGSSATSINDAGQVAGDALQSGGPVDAVVWNNGTPTVLAPLVSGGQYSTTLKINNSGQVVGNSTASDGDQQAVVWNGKTPTSLGPSPGGAYGINDRGVVVGYIDVKDSGSPVVWHGTTPTYLQRLATNGGTPDIAYAINESGLIVGAATANSGSQHAAFWAHSAVADLGTLGGAASLAMAVNSRNVIVGSSDTLSNVSHATVWSYPSGRPIDLNQLIDSTLATDITLEDATGINDACMVIANGIINKTHVSAAFVLTLNDPSRCGRNLE